jgi:histidinol dehydrogenase
MAYGTDSVPAVCKITGPGNIYVAFAKKSVYGQVGIDMIAGPSEVLVIADSDANPAWVAADFISQAEHDEMAACILVTDDAKKAEAVKAEVKKQTAGLSRRGIIEASLKNYGTVIICEDMDDCIDTANMIAPEHLELCVREPMQLLSKVKNAGSVFLGEYSPEPLGDYFAGANHVLPTNGTARFSSPLNVDDFQKKSSVIYYSRKAFEKEYKKVEKFALAEGLTAHANSAAIRFEGE